MSTIGAVGQLLGLRGLKSSHVTLQAGATRTIPAGNFVAVPGPYTFVQVLDPITGVWRNMNQVGNTPQFIESDGVNFRLANQTGCCVGAVVNVGGTSYVGGATGVTVSAATGGAVFAPVVGGAIATTGTFASVGTGYVYPPLIEFSPPPAGGVPATGHITISSSTGSSIVIDNQGAGYTGALSASQITITNDPRDTTGTGMTVTSWTIASTAAGAITACLVTNHGVAIGTVPTLSTGSSGSGTSATLTAIMCLAITAGTIATVGSGYGTATSLALTNGGFFASGTTAWTNPAVEKSIFQPRAAYLTLTAGTSLTTVGTIMDGGLHQGLPTVLALNSQAVVTAAGAVTITAGGVTDTSFLLPC